MSFSNIKQIDRHTVKFTLSPLTVSYANTLRRLMMTGVETVGFKGTIDAQGKTGNIIVKKNDTPMTNEMLAHRISMIPLAVKDPLTFKPENYLFRLNVVNDGDRPIDVCASDFEVFEQIDAEQEPVRIPTERFFPANPITGDTALIAVLKGKQYGQIKGYEINIEARASVSTGRDNAAYMPVAQCSYENTPDTNPDKLKEVFENWLTTVKKTSIEELKEDAALEASLKREFDTMEVARCYLENEYGEPYSYDFTIETAGVMNVANIVRRACEVGEAMCMRYANVDSGELPEGLTVSRTTMMMPGFDFMFKGHDHTLGNSLQTYLVENHIDGEAEPVGVVNYAGYCVPHPLHDVMKLTIGVNDGKEESARKALAIAARGVAEIFRNLRNEWLSAIGEIRASSRPRSRAPSNE